ncbi:MAG: hypothetical protein J5506_00560 [Prevotella sp.]|nr:hypothetical protein [Prevotella sp.]
MPSFNNLEMAAALSNDNRISIKKGFLGIGTKAVYQPTQSALRVIIKEYNADNGLRIEKLLNTSAEKLAAEVERCRDIQDAQIGNMHLEVCASRDGQFVAAQLFRFVDFKYQAVTSLRTFEGNDAGIMSVLL